MEALHTRRKRTGWRNVSQFARATGAEIRQRLLCELVEPARFGVALDLLVESSGLEFLKPSAESRELIRRQFGHRLFDIFERCHGHPRRLAVGAVRIERVSAAKFLSIREKNREFCKFKGSSTIGGRKIADVADD